MSKYLFLIIFLGVFGSNIVYAKEDSYRIEEPYYFTLQGGLIQTELNYGFIWGLGLLFNFPWIEGLVHGPVIGSGNLKEYKKNIEFDHYSWEIKYFLSQLPDKGFYLIGGIGSITKIYPDYNYLNEKRKEFAVDYIGGIGYSLPVSRETSLFLELRGEQFIFDKYSENNMTINLGLSL